MRSATSCSLFLGVVLLSLMPGGASSKGDGVPLQANVAIPMPVAAGVCRSFSSNLEGGAATVVGTVCNQAEGQTAQIEMLFDYRSGVVAFDEIIERIELTAELTGGVTHASAQIWPEHVNLNPNRVSLSYRVTLYYPPDSGPSYVARVKVFGNYE